MLTVFLVLYTQLFKRFCPSVGPSVRDDLVEKWKNERIKYFVLVRGGSRKVGVGGLGGDGGWMSLPTRPQGYCDPASLFWFKVK